jgi:tryptophan synthase beta chain
MSTDVFGAYGGRYVPETLIPALDELERGWRKALADDAFHTELHELATTYAGRPTPLTLAERFAPGKRIYLKREDLLHTGAHKLNNALGQAVLARRLGKRRIVAETGAGQHGVAAATVCARFGYECVVYMGEEDMRRQKPNVERMGLLGAEVRSVDFGTKTLKEATSEAIRDWITNVETTHYLIGSCVGPAPYPVLVAELHSVIGREAREHAYLRDLGRAEYVGATDEEALQAFGDLARTEGIIPALEPSHALARARELDAELILVCLSGRGDKDLAEVLAQKKP